MAMALKGDISSMSRWSAKPHPKIKRTAAKWISAVLAVLGLFDVPDQVAKLRVFLNSSADFLGFSWASFSRMLSSDALRWIFFVLAVAVGLWAWDVWARITARFRRSAGSSGDAGRSVPTSVLSSQPLAPEDRETDDRTQAVRPGAQGPVTLEWLVAHQDSPQGLHIGVTNVTPDVLADVKVLVLDVRRFQASSGKFVPVQHLHNSRGEFRELRLRGPSHLYPDRPARYEFLTLVGPAVLQFQGDAAGVVKLQIRETGEWRATFRFAAGGAEVDFERCFRWAEAGSPPAASECPTR